MTEAQRIVEVIAEAQSMFAYDELLERVPANPDAEDYEDTLSQIIAEKEYSHCQLKNSKILIRSEAIKAQVKKAAGQLNKIYSDNPMPTTLVCVLTGGLYYFADLTRHLNFKADVECIKCSSYIGEKQKKSTHTIDRLSDLNLNGRRLIIIDDVLDTGQTGYEISKYYNQLFSIKEMVFCSLAHKPFDIEEMLFGHLTDYIHILPGIAVPQDAWLIGYGLDGDAGYDRNLPYIITKE